MQSEQQTANHEHLLDGLNAQQRLAVTFNDGPLLIVAGAGTGKTSVLTKRIAYLIGEGLCKPHEILALTFTDKAAKEMQERVDILLPYGASNCAISTFNSFGNRILRDYAVELGLSSGFTLMSSAEQVVFLTRHLFQLPLKRYRPLGNPVSCLRDLVSHFGRLKDELIEPAQYVEWAKSLFEEAQSSQLAAAIDRANSHLELAQAYQAYHDLCLRTANLDFGDQIYLTARLLDQSAHVRNRICQTYRYILVDEFQDTNYAQFELVRMLCQSHQQLTVVGDDDQAIYAFRGAAISNILGFQRAFPQARQIVLTSNYRSSQPILDAAYRLILHNNPYRLEAQYHIDKKLVAQGESSRQPLPPSCQQDGAVHFTAFTTLSDEAESVAQRIDELREAGIYSLAEMAILVRTNRDSDAFIRALNGREIAYRFSGNDGLYLRPEVKVLLSYLRFLANPKDSLSLFSVLSSDVYNFPARELIALNACANKEHLDLLEVLQMHGSSSGLHLEAAVPKLRLPESVVALIDQVLSDYCERVREISQLNAGQILYQFCQSTGWFARLMQAHTGQAVAAVENVSRFFQILRRFQENESGMLLPELVQQLNALIDAGDSPAVVESDPEAEAVSVLTVHSSKGLEFPMVFLVGLSDRKFPARTRLERLEFPRQLAVRLANSSTSDLSDEELNEQEERRLFYVAVTRAKRQLWMSHSVETGQRGSNRISPFVPQALGGGQWKAPRPSSQVGAEERLKREAPLEPSTPEPMAPISPEVPIDLSYARIADYLDCPLRFRYAHVLHAPAPPSLSLFYGTAMHAAISALLKSKLHESPISLDQMLQVFSEHWKPYGALCKEHAIARLEAGKQSLARFYRQELPAPPPIEVECMFSVRVNAPQGGLIRIRGRIDRLDRAAGGELLITDYKTREIDPDKADFEAEKSLQLKIYALACEVERTEMPVLGRLNYVDSNVVGSTPLTRQSINDAVDQIVKVADGVRRRDYAARPSSWNCRSCAYRTVCSEVQM